MQDIRISIVAVTERNCNQFRNAVNLQYEWPIDDILYACWCVHAGKSLC